MFKSFANVFRIPELRKRILYTLGLIVVFRIGGHIPIPGINTAALGDFFANQQGGLFGVFDMFTGGALQRATIFALGIMPYISASIILQMLGAVFPYYQKLQQMGEEGRKKINQHTRYFTVILSLVQAFGITVWLRSMETQTGKVVLAEGVFEVAFFTLMSMITFTAGTIFIMWLGEQITERGIGNGISLLIMVGIVDRFPSSIATEVSKMINGLMSPITMLVLIALFVVVVAAVVLLNDGTRKIPVQYAKRVIGGKMYGGQNTYIPLKVNTSGVIPIIFAQSILFFPQTIASFFPDTDFMQTFATLFSYQHWFYWLVYSLMIVFFAYFYTAIVFNPVDLAENMKRNGGFVPGVRPGKPTATFIDYVLTRITLPGSIALALVAVFPYMIMNWMNVDYGFASFFGGTGLLIVVGVALDTLQQIESHLTMRHYETFLKSGKMRGRRG